MTKSIQKKKKLLRAEYKRIRQSLSKERRDEAEAALVKHLGPYLEPYPYVLSFASKDDEISTKKLNELLLSRNQLVLPRVNGDHLDLFQVNDLIHECELSKFGILEPKQDFNKKILYEEISIALVPAIACDKNHNRLGYGFGFYDKLLSYLKCPTMGVVFKEQLFQGILPREEYDIACNNVFVF